MAETEIGAGQWLLEGPGRRILLSTGVAKTLAYSGFSLSDDDRLVTLRAHIADQGGTFIDSPSPLLRQGAFAVRDPDGNTLCFGVERPATAATAADDIEGRLQHVVVASPDLDGMMDYYERVLGFLPSDHVLDDEGTVTAAFYRSDPEHHSFAAFRAAERGFDHCAFETPSWNHIRDWADHLATLDIPIWWGPGRHGAGNNLFFMILDPDGNKVELSAELEHMDADHPVRHWPHDRRTLNLWGNAWMRS
jgi:catechol 2,3-dioxygenase-like lactoylglutathione lyase family enzyme